MRNSARTDLGPRGGHDAPAAPVALAVAVACLLAFGLLLGAVVSRVTLGADRSVIAAVASLSGSLAPLRLITEAGSTLVVTVLTLLLGVALLARRHIALALLAVGTVGASALLASGLIKNIVARARPDVIHALAAVRGFSFPSGHATLSATLYGVVAVLIWRTRWPLRLRVAAITALGVLVVLVGLSRIYLGVHYPSDVLAGWLLGTAMVSLFTAASARLRRGRETLRS
ncbi:MAG: acid phosphatase [Chloroflexi bacterium]|nr:MAG: acid phosphatase [Chloroflexota bacterium]